MKTFQHGVKIFKKMCTFEVSIGLLPFIWIVSSKEFIYTGPMRIHQEGAKISNKKCSFEVSIGLLPLILIVSLKESLL